MFINNVVDKRRYPLAECPALEFCLRVWAPAQGSGCGVRSPVQDPVFHFSGMPPEERTSQVNPEKIWQIYDVEFPKIRLKND